VRDALIDGDEPDRPFGTAARDNPVRRADRCNAFLVRFDLAKLALPPEAYVATATVSFSVWDPSSRGKTKVCAFPLQTAWDEVTATWRAPALGQSWQGGQGFRFDADAGPAGPAVVVESDQGSDTVDPPVEYQLDVTELVRTWLDGGAPNHGLAIAPVIDPSVDGGSMTRFQIYGSEHGQEQDTPKLTVQVQPAPEPLRTVVLQGQAAVRDALIDGDEPDRPFGTAARDNPVRRADRCNAFLVRFDLAKLALPPEARIVKAMVSFYVWDPSSGGRTKVCALPLQTAWDEVTATWRAPALGQSWQGGQGFRFDADAGPAGPAVVVEPDQGSDTVDPPVEYQLDVTELVHSWLDGGAPNHGLAIAPVIDPSVDRGISTRFQVYGSEHSRGPYTPKLTVQVPRCARGASSPGRGTSAP
jgi:hypothetical protein